MSNPPLPDKAEDALKLLGVAFKRLDDGSLLVDGDLDLGQKNLKKLPDLTNVIVTGHFFCRYNYLTSLKGSPQTVGGSFFCNGNKLLSLKHAPEEVGKDFFCNNNQDLKDLEHAPQQFQKLESDLGNFRSWDDVPDHLRISAASKARQIAEGMSALSRPVKALRRPSFGNRI